MDNLSKNIFFHTLLFSVYVASQKVYIVHKCEKKKKEFYVIVKEQTHNTRSFTIIK